MLAFVAASILAPVSNSSAEQQVLANVTSGDYSIAVTGQGTINLDVNQPDATGKLVTAADNLVIAANAPKGYKLYISMDNALTGGNRLYKDGSTSSAFIAPNQNSSGQDIPLGSETPLPNNSWGFTTDTTKYNNNQFAAVPLSSTPTQISSAATSGSYNQPVYYAAKVNTDMISGSYSGNIVYTITSEDAGSTFPGIKSISPSDAVIDEIGTATTNITISLFSTSGINTADDLGTITALIGDNACPITNKAISGNDLILTCTIPSSTVGTANVSVSIQRFGQTYTAENAFIYRSPAMQNFTVDDCVKLAISTASSPAIVNLRDSRDNTEYRISKLADGNCWMVDNLALNGTTNGTTRRTLTPADSDVTSNYTFPSGVDISVGTSSVDTKAQIVTRDKNNTDNGIKYGNYYNFLAATAGWGTTSVSSGDSPRSICPKGWKLPTYSGDKSFQNLGSQYGITGSNAFTTIRNAPLYFPAAGRYDSGVSLQGSYGHYWSRRVNNVNYAYDLLFSSSNYNYIPQDRYSKYLGFSVRCVFDPPAMQNFTAQDCTNLTLSTSSVDNRKLLPDTRDGTSYHIAKLADGNCWMVDNLALNGTTDGTTPRTLTPSDSDVTSNYTFPSGVDISSDTSVDTKAQIRPTDKNKTDNGNKYGNYYNFLAATAGWGTTSVSSGDSPRSICPKGWKLPAYSGDKSYYDLLTTNYGVTSSNVWATVRNAPLYFPAAGRYYSVVVYQGSYGYYWSRRVSGTDGAYLYFDSDNYYPQRYYNKVTGFSVRCVFGG